MSDGKRRIGKTAFSAGSAVLVLVIVVLVNILLSRTTLRWDATEDNLYSLSQGTRTILAELDQEVVVKVFYSKHVVNIPSHIKTFAQRVIDFLSEYEQYGKGRISVEIYDPKPDSEEEEWAIKYGMKGISLPTGEQVYLGLVALAADQEAAIAFIDPTQETRLEYDLTRIIARVQTTDRMKIAVFSSLPVFGQAPMNMGMAGPRPGSEPWFFIQELEKTYDLIKVQPDADRIDPTADLLVLFHPRNMSDMLAFAVDQYIMGGGNAIVFADPLSLMDDPRMGPGGSIPETAVQGLGDHHGAGKGRCRLHLRHSVEEPQQPGGDQSAVALRPSRRIFRGQPDHHQPGIHAVAGCRCHRDPAGQPLHRRAPGSIQHQQRDGGRLRPQHGCGRPAAGFQTVGDGPQSGRAHIGHV